MTAKRGLAFLLLILVLSPYMQPSFGNSIPIVVPEGVSYIEPSFKILGDGSYEYTTRFGIYTITYLPTLYAYSVSFKNGDTIVTASALILQEDSSGAWLPINTQTKSFTIGTPTFAATLTGEHFSVTQTLTYTVGKKQVLGELTFIVQFSKSAFPKISVALNKSCAQYSTDPITHEQFCSLTNWDDAKLKDMRWVWSVAPASGYDKYQSDMSGEVNVTTAVAVLDVEPSVRADFKGAKNWYADWSSVGLSDVTIDPASVLGSSVLVVHFAVNMTVIDPTFGLTSTGSTSYPTAKAVTANGDAQIDTAQSKFGGASGLFDGTGDYATTPDSADWAFAAGNFTIDFWVQFYSLGALNTGQVIAGQYVDNDNRWYIRFAHQTAGDNWHVFFRDSATTRLSVYCGYNPVANNTWYHLALVRAGNVWSWYRNGLLQSGSSTTSFTVADLNAVLNVGNYGTGTTSLNGWLDEFRISKGVARWTSNFTPAIARYDRDSSTVYLDHMDGTDTSTTFLDDVTTGLAKATWFRLTDNNAGVSSVSFYTHTAGNYRVSIWNDTGATAPDNLLWESGDTAASATTWNNVTISSGTPSSLTLQSGIVWLAWQWNPGVAYAAGPSYTAGSANNGTYLYQAYGAFPASWSGTASSEKWSIYASYSTNQNYNAALSDSGSGAESVLRAIIGTRGGSSSGSGAESVSLQGTHARSLSDVGSGLVTMLALIAGIRSGSDSGSGQESLERLLAFTRTTSSTGSGSDIVSLLQAIQRSLSDLGSGLESIAALLAGIREITETGSGQESLTASRILQRILSNAGSGLDSLARQVIFGRTVSESGSGSEDAAAQAGLSRLVSDVGSGLESLVRALTFQRANVEQGSGQDTLTRLFGVSRNVSDAGAGLDSVIRQVLFGRSATDSGSGSEDAGGQTGLSRMLSEIGTGIEDVIQALSFGRTNSEQGSGQDALARIFAASRNTSDSGSGSESLTQILGHTANLFIQGTGTETLSRLMALTRSSSDGGVGTELLSRLFAASRSILDLGSALETLTHLLTPYVPPSTGGAGGGVIIKPLPTTVMVGAVFPRSIYFLLPGARVSQDITVTNPTNIARTVTVHYTVTNLATGKIVYEDTLRPTVTPGSSTYTTQVTVTETGRYRIDITATDGGTATAKQEFDIGLWQIWQGPVLLWSIIAFVAAALILFYKRIQEEW